MSCQCFECAAMRDDGDDGSTYDFNPNFDMPRTGCEALAVVAAWGDPGTMTFTAEKAKRCAELLRVGNVIEQQDGIQPKVGDSVSIDISTCDEDAGARHFGRIVGYQKEHDGTVTWLCECEGYNQHPVQQPIPTSERLPTEADADFTGNVLALDSTGSWDFWTPAFIFESHSVQSTFFTHWLPTGLKRPEEPETKRKTRTQIPDGVTRVRNAATGAVVWEKPAEVGGVE